MVPEWYRRQYLPGGHAFARSGRVPNLGRRRPDRPELPPFRPAGTPLRSPMPSPREGGPRCEAISAGAAIPGSTATGRTAFHLDALYALAYLHSHDDQAARQQSPAQLALCGVNSPPGPPLPGSPAPLACGEPWPTSCTPVTPPGQRGKAMCRSTPTGALWVPCAARPSPCTPEAAPTATPPALSTCAARW